MATPPRSRTPSSSTTTPPGAPAAGGAASMGPPPTDGRPGGGNTGPGQSPHYSPSGKPPPVVPVKKLPKSQFHSGKTVPDIDLSPLDMPDTHVTPEFCLEQMARVLEELAEKQEDPVWVQTHIALAESWRTAAELLLNHAVQGKQIEGDAHIKQQELYQNDDLHQQTLAHNDQAHFQKVKQQDDQHAQGLKQQDDLHKTNLQQQKLKADQAQQTFKLDQQHQQAKQKIDLQKAKQPPKRTP